MKNNLVELRKQAEQAVHDMPEGDLKVAAFQTVLTHLLSNSAAPGRTAAASPDSKKSSPKQHENAAGPPETVAQRLLSLKSDDFFSSQKSIGEIRQELKKHGWHYPVTGLSGPLQSLVQKKVLRREHSDEKGKKGWKYSNW